MRPYNNTKGHGYGFFNRPQGQWGRILSTDERQWHPALNSGVKQPVKGCL
jgi:hypothetical protein